ncbi:altered inheritance rate of mitochondria protein 25 [Diospyros lotus]|uniref:altered inheritance rate of mitochondria protein 25 n=1 Tax=Diospyros lotus TaxID=55363 RepID=UPI00225B41AB|nr:altered inheritance rate of mitochondria protein 25 [Diospyros lotus]XP_052176461.1 altered inheritance rate of mitochondria protein 25 [Diospyros lotus]XP_052176469.1 altered inheritance rate of mitochondria protein 25 [Diospyros lotus]
MNWIKGLILRKNFLRSSGEIFRCRQSEYSSVNKLQKGVILSEKIYSLGLQPERRCTVGTLFQHAKLDSKHADLQETSILTRNTLGKLQLSCHVEGDISRQIRHRMTIFRQYGQSKHDPELNRDFLALLWVADKKVKRPRSKKRQKVVNNQAVFQNKPSFRHLLGGFFSAASADKKRSYDPMKPVINQPPLSQSATGILEPASLEEARIAPLLARSNLLITRNIEWANVVFGFEQENQYAIVDICYPQSPVGFILEQSNVIARQLLRLRRPFVASITDAMGNELFRVRRPFWWMTSSIYAEIDGKELGVVHRRWHLWKRIYDLYLGNKQFSVVENPGFWNWTFTLKDMDGRVLAEIDRNWRGFGFEIFTDAGQYVIRFGTADAEANVGPAGMVQELEVVRPLTLSERAIALALAVSLDNDYFSRRGGWVMPFVDVGE